jgi:ABC-2 type transport system ATP-binding protein
VNAVCTRAIIIAQGRLVADERPQALEARSRYHNAVTLGFVAEDEMATARGAIAALPQVLSVETSEREQRLTALPRPGELILPIISELARQRRWKVNELHLESGRLDEVFRGVTQAPAAAGAARGG